MTRRDDLIGHKNRLTEAEISARQGLSQTLSSGGIPAAEVIDNLNLFAPHIVLGKTLFINHLYKKILGVPGVVFEFGVRWGQNMALFGNLRALYEPYNHLRTIVGFDTFEGFPSTSDKDGKEYAKPGNYTVADGWCDTLDHLLDLHEAQQPIPQIKKHELVMGDVGKTLPRYLNAHPATVIALAYFDLDLYEPTLFALRAVGPYLTRGSILAFDEFCHPRFPGETIAIREALGLRSISVRRVPWTTNPAWVVVKN